MRLCSSEVCSREKIRSRTHAYIDYRQQSSNVQKRPVRMKTFGGQTVTYQTYPPIISGDNPESTPF